MESKMAATGHQMAEKRTKYTDVVVIGNGPSAITLSYFLSGHRPYHDGTKHPNVFLTNRLRESQGISLVEQDLEYLCEGLEGRSSNPVAVLFDALTHPEADLDSGEPSILRWEHQPENVIPHVVLGRGPPGGAWQMMEGKMQTLSLGNWMELPGLPFRCWLAKHRRTHGIIPTQAKHDRASMEDIKHYYEDYVRINKLESYFRSHTIVTSVQRVAETLNNEIDSESGEVTSAVASPHGAIWEVRGYHLDETLCRGFCYRTQNVVLATGTFDIPNKIGLPGESNDYILHSIAEFEKVVENGHLGPNSNPLVIVGAGLSAADAIIMARSLDIPVVHISRRSNDDPMLIYNKLPPALYPEYREVLSMMNNSRTIEGYVCYTKHQISDIMQDRKILISGDNSPCDTIIEVSYVLVLIGSRPNLSFLPQEGRDLGVVPNAGIHCKHNPIDIDPYSYQSVHQPGLFGMGPLVGDNFVRFLRGGALGITNYLHRRQHAEQL